jgi:hypothetical protein
LFTANSLQKTPTHKSGAQLLPREGRQAVNTFLPIRPYYFRFLRPRLHSIHRWRPLKQPAPLASPAALSGILPKSMTTPVITLLLGCVMAKRSGPQLYHLLRAVRYAVKMTALKISNCIIRGRIKDPGNRDIIIQFSQYVLQFSYSWSAMALFQQSHIDYSIK